MDRNQILKVAFMLVAAAFLIVLITTPKTNCEVCEIEYEGKTINGFQAWGIFERECISYAKPWSSRANEYVNFTLGNITEKEYVYINIDCINSTYDENGVQIIDIDKECAENETFPY